MKQIKIFLSSTFVDLSDIRSQVSQWLTGIFGAQLIVMETFGSDTPPPDILSVRRVGECDLYVGIYAHRFGTIDISSGKSITELELDEARRAYSAGTIREILLYLIDSSAPWSKEHIESSASAQAGLERIREKAKLHTYTLFKTKGELLFYIIRDVHKKLLEHFTAPSLIVRHSVLPAPINIRKPSGMEFLTSADRHYLVGRENDINNLLSLLGEAPVVLLLGDSGIGKTSLIHAGLIPRAATSGMRTVYTRPFGLPCSDVVQKIQTSIFEGAPHYRGPLVPLLAEVTAQLKGERVLLIIDQLEDVLNARDITEIEQLISGLRAIRELGNPSLRVLISYRADLEGRLGVYWQQISGSPSGLPRLYLGGIKKDLVWDGIGKILSDLSIKLNLREAEQERISNDLQVSSTAAGFSSIYPPYIQMLVDHIWSSSQEGRKPYVIKDYQDAGGMDGVIGGFLTRRLEYAQDREGHVRSVLVSLVRSYGVKAQRTLEEITLDTGIDESRCELALEKLIDLRLVRHIDQFYEVSHDFIAKRIISELVDSEEHQFKRFRELLTSKAAAYKITNAPLTPQELLLIFKHKDRVIPNELELRLLLISWLQGNGPALYWLLNAERTKVLEWLRAQETKEDLDREEKVSIILLRRKLGERTLTDKDCLAFRHYQLSAEMAHLVLDNPLSLSMELLIYGLRHPREEVREACLKAVPLQIQNGNWSWIKKLRNSSSTGCRKAYQHLIMQEEVSIPEKMMNGGRATEEFVALKRIALARDSKVVRKALKELQKRLGLAHSLLFGRALAYVREGRIKKLLKEAWLSSTDKAETLLAAITGSMRSGDFNSLLSTYKEWNSREGDRYKAAAVYGKANALAHAIGRCMENRHLSALRGTFKAIRLTPSSRGVVLALLKHGAFSDLKLVLDRIAKTEEKIDYWNHTELGMKLARRMEASGGPMPSFLLELFGKKEFWEYIPAAERGKVSRRDLLPIKCFDNRALYVRLAGYAMVGASRCENQEELIRLTTHYYGLVARAAASRLVRLMGESGIRKLSGMVDECILKGSSESLAHALRYAEMEAFGLARYG